MDEGQKVRGTKKKLIICCDSTACRESLKTNLTNVSRISQCISISDDDGIPQIVLYQPGVGTDPRNPLRPVDQATGAGIDENIQEIYAFICQNYGRADDEIYLIGFSRGAFTVRCVAKLIEQIGLLTKMHLYRLPGIFRSWSNKKPDDRLVSQLHQPGSYRSPGAVRIQVCAVWDTLSTIGLQNTRLSFVNSELGRNINHAFQALSLHERRSKFRPVVWKLPEHNYGTDPEEFGSSHNHVPDLQQCWFLGYHRDVGGGQKKDILAHFTLIWMISKLKNYLRFDFTPIWNEYYSPLEYGERLTWRGIGDKFDYKLKDSKRGVFRLLGSKHRIPCCHFWSSNGFQKTIPSRNSNESMHYTVRLLLKYQNVPRCKILDNGDLVKRTDRWVWRLRYGTLPDEEYEIEEQAPDDFEKHLLRGWLSQELIYIQDHSGPSGGPPEAIIGELLNFLRLRTTGWHDLRVTHVP